VADDGGVTVNVTQSGLTNVGIIFTNAVFSIDAEL
jgi:hypothetical protein